MEKDNQEILSNELDENLKSLLTVPSYKIGAYTFDVGKRMLSLNEESVKLTKKESYLLIFFAANVRKSLVRNEILTAIWKEDTYTNSRSMDVYICKLRKLLSKDPNIIIVNIHGKGFRMVID
jgi:two-component system OmpR family response regulator